LPGEVVVIAELDRLARSTRDLANTLGDLTAQQCGFVSLGESWVDTTSSRPAHADDHGWRTILL